MKILKLFFIVSFSLTGTSFATETTLKLDPKFMKPVYEFNGSSKSSGIALKHVYLIKQFHLSNENTKEKTDLLPQTKNMLATYNQVKLWIEQGVVKEVMSEGCSKDLELNEPEKILNGWAQKDLIRLQNTKEFDNIVLDPALKLKTKFGKKLKVTCGDNYSLVRDTLDQALPQMQNAARFFEQLREQTNDHEHFLITANKIREFYHLPQSTKGIEIIYFLSDQIRGGIHRTLKNMDERNLVAIKRIIESKDMHPVVIFGGMHAVGLSESLRKQGIAHTILEPDGYNPTDEEGFKKLEESLPKRPTNN